jgi:hypothetical protein
MVSLSQLGFTIFIASTVAGCGLAQQRQLQERQLAVQQNAKEIVEGCRARFSESAKDAIERAKCFNQADELLASVVPFPDLIHLRIAKRSELAEKQAAGKVSRSQAVLELAELQTNLVTEEQRRSNAARSVRAQEVSAIAASMPTTCTRIRNSMTCF